MTVNDNANDSQQQHGNVAGGLWESALQCPFCWEQIALVIDLSGGSHETVEDCPVCCRPICLRIVVGADGGLENLHASPE